MSVGVTDYQMETFQHCVYRISRKTVFLSEVYKVARVYKKPLLLN